MPEFTRYFLFFDSNVGTPVTVNKYYAYGASLYYAMLELLQRTTFLADDKNPHREYRGVAEAQA